MSTPEGTADLSARLRAVPTTCISDAMDRCGLNGAMRDIRVLDAGMGRMAGPARTILQAPRRIDAVPGQRYIRHIPLADDTLAPGEVLVIGVVGAAAGSSWGYLLSLRSRARGAAGTVVDGSVRDPAQIIALGYPVFAALKTCAAGSSARLETIAADTPVFCGGLQVRPGDYVVGDDSGVVVVPAERAAEIADSAHRIFRSEEESAARILSGGPLLTKTAG